MLAPPSVADITLDAAIVQLAQFLRDETDIPVTLDLDPVPALPNESQLLLIASVQMWFARAIRRRAGRSLSVRLREHPKQVVLRLEMSPPPAGALAGWTVLREHARALSGDLSIESSSGRVIASVSLPEGSAA
jgi:nitrate/nitrite-specific signal transduction histidine kinase